MLDILELPSAKIKRRKAEITGFGPPKSIWSIMKVLSLLPIISIIIEIQLKINLLDMNELIDRWVLCVLVMRCVDNVTASQLTETLPLDPLNALP